MTMDEQLPVFIVRGSNWTCEVRLDKDDAELSRKDQAIEAVTKALEAIAGITENYTLKRDNEDELPSTGSFCIAYLKDTNPEETTEWVETWECYGNAGLYRHAAQSKAAFEKDREQAEAAFADIDKVRAAEVKALEQIEQDLRELQQLRKEIAAGRLIRKEEPPKPEEED